MLTLRRASWSRLLGALALVTLGLCVAPQPSYAVDAGCNIDTCTLLGNDPGNSGTSGGPSKANQGSGSSGSSGPKPHPLYGWYGWDWVYVDEHIGTIIPECVVGPLYTCPTARDIAAVQAASPQPLRPSFSDVSAIARQLVLTMSVDRPVIRVGPDPSANEWNMAVVGHPLWLWTTEPGTKSATMTSSGYRFTLAATRTSVTFDPGDGTGAITCRSMSAYPGSSAVGRTSPTCGHTYQHASPAGGSFTITATGTWEVDWSAMGYSGTIPLTLSQTRTLKVGELQAVRVG